MKKLLEFEIESGSSILAIVAHPDDEVLGCFGTLSRCVKAGGSATVLILNHGNQERLQSSEEIARAAGINVLVPSALVFAGTLHASREVVAAIDKVVDVVRPSTIVAHGTYDGDHQDHRVAGQVAMLCWQRHALRFGQRARFLKMPPVPCGLGFSPSRWVGIESEIEDKCSAMDKVSREGAGWRWYLDSNVCRAIAARSAVTVAADQSAFVEVFEEETRESFVEAWGLRVTSQSSQAK